MKNKILPLLFPLTILTLSGCSTNSTKCPIDLDGYPSCVSSERVLDAAREGEGDKISVLGKTKTSNEHVPKSSDLFGKEALEESSNTTHKPSSDDKIKIKRKFVHLETNPYHKKPVWIPEKIGRIWFAPWQDKYQNLHSSEIVFFKIPGSWSYGTLKSPGQIGRALMGPAEENPPVETHAEVVKPRATTPNKFSLRDGIDKDFNASDYVAPEITFGGK